MADHPCVKAGFDGVPLEHWVATEHKLRREHADRARLCEDVVLQALADIKAISTSATKRASIASPIITSADIDGFDRDVFRTFAFDRGPENGPPVLDAVDVTTQDGPDVWDQSDTAPKARNCVSGLTDDDNYGLED